MHSRPDRVLKSEGEKRKEEKRGWRKRVDIVGIIQRHPNRADNQDRLEKTAKYSDYILENRIERP